MNTHRRRKSASDLYVHTRDAMRIRHDRDLSPEQHAQLGEMVRAKKGELVMVQTGSRTIWKLSPVWMSEPIYVVYQKPMSQVCTVLSGFMVDQLLREHTPYQECA